MLRQARSLPSLRLLAEQQAHTMTKCAQQSTTKQFQAVAAPAVAPVAPKRSFGFFRRAVHSTSKKETILLDMNNGGKSKYSSMNCQGLKMECRKRGLKVSGRKLELIQRLCQSDEAPMAAKNGARSFSTTKEIQDAHKLFTKGKKKRTRKTKKQQREMSTTTATAAPAAVPKRPTVSVTADVAKASKKAASSSATTSVASAAVPHHQPGSTIRTFTQSAPKWTKDDASTIDYYNPPKPTFIESKVEAPSMSSPKAKASEEEGGKSSEGEKKKNSEDTTEEEKDGSRDAVIFGLSGLAIWKWWSMKDY